MRCALKRPCPKNATPSAESPPPSFADVAVQKVGRPFDLCLDCVFSFESKVRALPPTVESCPLSLDTSAGRWALLLHLVLEPCSTVAPCFPLRASGTPQFLVLRPISLQPSRPRPSPDLSVLPTPLLPTSEALTPTPYLHTSDLG